MIKDTFFSWSRFQLLLKKNILENWKTYSLRLLLMFGALAIGMIWNGYLEYSPDQIYPKENQTTVFMSVFFMWTLYIFGALSASFIMEELKTKTNRISFIMNPATQFEKFFMKWVIYVVIYFIVFLLLFKIADCLKVFILSITYPNNSHIELFSFSHIISFGNPDYYCMICSRSQLLMAISTLLFSQSLFILGGTIWPKNAFVKTFAAITIIIIIGSFITYHSFNVFYSGNSPELAVIIMSRFYIVITSILAVFNWIIAYYRFKEIEIINRM